MLYVGIEVYDKPALDILCRSEIIQGVVIGDLFCRKRMFEGGIFQLYDAARQLKEAGKCVCYQTPMYMTSRNFSEISQHLLYLYDHQLLDAVLLQDMGLLSYIRQKLLHAELIWNSIGIGRSRVSNRLYYEALQSLGIDQIQCETCMVAEKLYEHGFLPALVYGSLTYRTMNRECYYKYENDIYDTSCDRKCLMGKQFLESGDSMCIDGHLLGRKYIYEDADILRKTMEKIPASVFAYGKDRSDIKWLERDMARRIR